MQANGQKVRMVWEKSYVVLGLEEVSFERQEAIRSECFGAEERKNVGGFKC